MNQVPERLFQKATSLGFECCSDRQIHRISPAEALDSWCLVYRSGHWTLLIDGVAQMNLRYSEVIDFLERRANSEVSKTMVTA